MGPLLFFVLFVHLEFTTAVTWPRGTYGLPKPLSGCPSGHGKFPWHSGWRYHDTEDRNSNNHWSNPYHLAGYHRSNNMAQHFCFKTVYRTAGSRPWPRGQYCVFKKGNCPPGFRVGWIKWDDEDSNNRNRYGGSIPDGSYNHNTVMYYCCRTDGFATNKIHLPTDRPFVLFKSNSHQCQAVHRMRTREEYFYWDTEDSNPSNASGGSKPWSSVGRNIRIDYCYYY